MNAVAIATTAAAAAATGTAASSAVAGDLESSGSWSASSASSDDDDDIGHAAAGGSARARVMARLRALLPLASVVTPNIPEAMRFTGLGEPQTIEDMIGMARAMIAQGSRAVLVKGGHFAGAEASDVLVEGTQVHRFDAERIETTNTHGTGCTLSSAIAAHLARGATLAVAVEAAKAYLTQALRSSAALSVGQRHGPVNHLWPLTGR